MSNFKINNKFYNLTLKVNFIDKLFIKILIKKIISNQENSVCFNKFGFYWFIELNKFGNFLITKKQDNHNLIFCAYKKNIKGVR